LSFFLLTLGALMIAVVVSDYPVAGPLALGLTVAASVVVYLNLRRVRTPSDDIPSPRNSGKLRLIGWLLVVVGVSALATLSIVPRTYAAILLFVFLGFAIFGVSLVSIDAIRRSRRK
jgi:heme A synthase